MKKTNKYGHIKSMKDLENEILRLKIKKNIITEELGNNFGDFKESLRPMNLIKEALGLIGNGNDGSNKFQLLEDKGTIFNNGKIFTYLKYLALTVSAVKGGSTLIRKVKRLFH